MPSPTTRSLGPSAVNSCPPETRQLTLYPFTPLDLELASDDILLTATTCQTLAQWNRDLARLMGGQQRWNIPHCVRTYVGISLSTYTYNTVSLFGLDFNAFHEFKPDLDLSKAACCDGDLVVEAEEWKPEQEDLFDDE